MFEKPGLGNAILPSALGEDLELRTRGHMACNADTLDLAIPKTSLVLLIVKNVLIWGSAALSIACVYFLIQLIF